MIARQPNLLKCLNLWPSFLSSSLLLWKNFITPTKDHIPFVLKFQPSTNLPPTPEHKMSFKKILSSSYGKSNLSIHRDYILVSEDMRELALSCRWCMGILGQCVKMLNMHTLYCNTSTPKEECIKKFLRTCFVILKIGDTLCPTTSKASQS